MISRGEVAATLFAASGLVLLGVAWLLGWVS